VTPAHSTFAVLFGVSRRPGDRASMDEHLLELGELAKTAGARVVATFVQERGALSPATLLRKGKVEELRLLCDAERARLVIADDDLTPAQVRNLEEALELTVLDRSALILDIFARRARSREARTQVELAQLRYLMPRLTRRWTHLERQAGGIGQRGVGETQLETDRRLIRKRIARLEDDLSDIEKDRRERRKRREGIHKVALVGYTNAGKSTILNLLTGAGTFVEDRLFATLDPLVRRSERPGALPFLLIDTVGFIRKLPHGLVEAFASTLEETLAGDLILHVCDASAEEDELAAQIAAVESVLTEIGADELPRLLVLNKIDLCDEVTRRRLRNRHAGAVQVSAETGEGIGDLTAEIARQFAGRFVRVELLVPFDRGEVLGELYELGSPIEREEEPEGVRVRAHLPRGIAARYAEFRVPEQARDAAGGA
jgi:GTP-binding protein HflX